MPQFHRALARALFVLFGCGLGLGTPGCYSTGLKFAADVRRVAVPVFGNDSYERGIEFAMTDRVRDILLTHSEVALVTDESTADVSIRGKILRVEYPTLVGQQRERILEGSASIAVSADLVDPRTGRVLAHVAGSDVAEFTTTLGETRATAVAEAIEELSWKVLLGLSQKSRDAADREARTPVSASSSQPSSPSRP
jgi:hypothetical protein